MSEKIVIDGEVISADEWTVERRYEGKPSFPEIATETEWIVLRKLPPPEKSPLEKLVEDIGGFHPSYLSGLRSGAEWYDRELNKFVNSYGRHYIGQSVLQDFRKHLMGK